MVLVKGAGAGAHPPRQAAGRRPGRRCGGARDWDGGWWGRGVRAPVPLCTQARDCTRSNGCRARQGVCLQCESGAQNRCGVRKALFRATIRIRASKRSSRLDWAHSPCQVGLPVAGWDCSVRSGPRHRRRAPFSGQPVPHVARGRGAGRSSPQWPSGWGGARPGCPQPSAAPSNPENVLA